MSDDKPALLGIARQTSADTFQATFRIDAEGSGEITICLPQGTSEEDMVAVARDHFWRLMQATASATAAWELPDDVRQKIDPDRLQKTGFANRFHRS